jgi:hypothetical protein
MDQTDAGPYWGNQGIDPEWAKANCTDTTLIRQLIDQYQGTCYPLNRTSIHALLDVVVASRTQITARDAEIVRLRAELAEWEVASGGNMAFFRTELGRVRAALRLVRPVLESELYSDELEKILGLIGSWPR